MKRFVYRSVVTPNWEEQPIIEGRVESIETRLIEKRKVPCATILCGDTRYTVLASAGLSDLFPHLKPGVHVKIESLGLIKTGKKRPFRKFACEAWIGKGGRSEKAQDQTRKARTKKSRKS